MTYFLLECFAYLVRGARPALLLFAGVVLIRWARGREISFEPTMLWGFLWIWWLVTLMRAMGFAGLEGGWHWSIFHPVRFSVGLNEYGSVRTLLLYVLMFAPCGFLTPRAFRWITWDMARTLAFGVLISYLIEMLRTPSGGFVEVGGLILGAVGTVAGYLAHDLFESLGSALRSADER